MFCVECGTALNDGQKFYHICGARVKEISSEENHQQQDSIDNTIKEIQHNDITFAKENLQTSQSIDTPQNSNNVDIYEGPIELGSNNIVNGIEYLVGFIYFFGGLIAIKILTDNPINASKTFIPNPFLLVYIAYFFESINYKPPGRYISILNVVTQHNWTKVFICFGLSLVSSAIQFIALIGTDKLTENSKGTLTFQTFIFIICAIVFFVIAARRKTLLSNALQLNINYIDVRVISTSLFKVRLQCENSQILELRRWGVKVDAGCCYTIGYRGDALYVVLSKKQI